MANCFKYNVGVMLPAMNNNFYYFWIGDTMILGLCESGGLKLGSVLLSIFYILAYESKKPLN